MWTRLGGAVILFTGLVSTLTQAVWFQVIFFFFFFFFFSRLVMLFDGGSEGLSSYWRCLL
jgi:hypothetical protein